MDPKGVREQKLSLAPFFVVASAEGDVTFNGRLSATGDFMCGTVTYHGGATFPMVAQKRPSAYRSQPQAERAR